MKATRIVVAVATAGALGLALLMWPSARRGPEQQIAGGDPPATVHRPVAAAAPRSDIADKRTDVASALAGPDGVELPDPVRAEQATPLERQMAASLAGLEAEQDPMRREELIEAAMDKLAGADFGDVMAYLQGTASNLSLDMAARLMRRWAEHDPAAAGEWAAGMPEGAARQAALEQSAIVWANRDPAGAAEWVRRLPAGHEHDRVVRQVAYETARTAPVTALVLAVELDADPDRDELIRYAARQWAAEDPAAAAEWAAGIEDGALRNTVMAGVATAVGDEYPLEAATMAAEELPPGRAQDDAVVGIVQRWAQIDPIGAAGWVSEFPEAAVKEIAMDNLVDIWADQDGASLDVWLRGTGGNGAGHE